MHMRKYLVCERFPNLPENLASPRCGDATDVTVSFPRLFESLMQLLGRCLQEVDSVSQGSHFGRECDQRTVFTRPSTSPVVGHLLSSRSPEPPQAPS